MKGTINYSAMAPCLLAIIIDSMGYGLVYPLMTSLLGSNHSELVDVSNQLRHFYLGLSFLLYPLFMFFGSSIMGDLSDILGRKKVLILCMSGLFVSFIFMGIGMSLVNLPLLFIGRALSGLMAGSQPIAQAAISDLSTPETKAKNIGIMTLVLSVGIVIGPVIGGLFSDNSLSHWFQLSTPFYIAAALALINTLWIIVSFKESFSTFDTTRKIDWKRPIQIFVEGFHYKRIRYLACVFILMQIGFSLYYQLIQVYLATTYNYPSYLLGLFNAYIGFSFAIVTLLGIRLFLNWFTVGTIAVVTLFATGLWQVMPMFFSSIVFLWIAGFLTAGFDMVAYGALMTTFSDSVSEKRQGWVMGLFNGSMAACWALTGFSTNLIPYIGIRWLIISGGILIIISSILMFNYNRRKNSMPITL